MNIVKKKSAECARMVSVRVPAALLDEFESLRERFDDAGYSIRITDVVVDAIKQAVKTLPRQLVKLQASTAVNTGVNTDVCTDGITECQFQFTELSQPPVPAPEPAEGSDSDSDGVKVGKKGVKAGDKCKCGELLEISESGGKPCIKCPASTFETRKDHTFDWI